MGVATGLFTGYIIMKAFQKQKKGNEALSFGGQIEVSHSLDGRIRFRSELLKISDISNLVTIQLTKIEGIKKVAPTLLTGSLLIEFDSSKIDKDLLVGAVYRLIGVEESLGQLQHSKVYDEIKSVNNALNHAVLDKTKGFLDVKTVVPISFVGLAAYQIASSKFISTPSSLTLLWWAYKSSNLGGQES